MRAIVKALVVLAIVCGTAAGEERLIRLGMIGLDTSHAVRYTELLNDPENASGCRVVAAWPGGSPDMAASVNRIEGFTKTLRDKHGVRIVSSIEELCGEVDGILLESVDGRRHLEQARAVIEAGKPLFIDKPVAGSLAEAVEIFRLAEEAGVACWSSSPLRFAPGLEQLQGGEQGGKVLGCDTYGPCAIDEHHPDLYWYGVHGVEVLFTLMGPGCESVERVHTEDYDVVVGTWADGRIGTYRGLRKGKASFGATVFGTAGIEHGGPLRDYYPATCREIAKFFRSGKAPVSAAQTLEIFAFMSAADVSKERGGASVEIAEVLRAAQRRAEEVERVESGE